jgi:hypothetical protein
LPSGGHSHFITVVKQYHDTSCYRHKSIILSVFIWVVIVRIWAVVDVFVFVMSTIFVEH